MYGVMAYCSNKIETKTEINMNEEASNPNIEWKKTGFDFNERITLKTNVRKAVEYEAKNKNSGLKNKYIPNPAELPNGLKKIRKKIKDVWDDEDEDENDYQVIAVNSPEEYNMSLMDALQTDEKKFLKQNEDIQNINTLQQTERNQQIANADKMAKDSGLKGLDKNVLAQTSQNISIGEDLAKDAILGQVARSFKYKGAKLPAKDAKKLITGIKRIQQAGGKNAVSGMSLKDVLEAGKKSSGKKDVIKKMLEKSGRIENKNNKIKIQTNELQLKNADLAKKLEKISRI